VTDWDKAKPRNEFPVIKLEHGKVTVQVLRISARTNRSWVLVLMCALSLGILFQILGTDISFWDLVGLGNVIESTELDVFAVIPLVPWLALLWSGTILPDILCRGSSLTPHLIFRPPVYVC